MVQQFDGGAQANLVSIVAHGKVNHDDYRKVIVPAVENKLKTHPKIRFLYHLDSDFRGYSLRAMWDDAVLGMRHFRAFEKAAVVTDVRWIRKAAAFFRFLMPCPVRLFHNDELPAATAWINA